LNAERDYDEAIQQLIKQGPGNTSEKFIRKDLVENISAELKRVLSWASATRR